MGEILTARLHHYRLPLFGEWTTAAGRFALREGWLLRIATCTGESAFGDCAPLAAIGTESLPQAEQALRDFAARLPGQGVAEALAELPAAARCRTPAARCAVECALVDLLAQAARQTLCAWLLPGGAGCSGIAVNAALGKLQTASRQAISAACEQGYSILKFKVAMVDTGLELARLKEIAAWLPAGVQLRLDANRGWTLRQASRFITACATLPLESLEEPLINAQPEDLRALQDSCGFALALDESLAQQDLDDFLATPPVRRLILKPPRLGGLLPALALARHGASAGVDSVVTSSVDSACGIFAAAHLAAALDNGLAHGLATSSWLSADTGPAPAIENGRLRLVAPCGAGFVAHRDLAFS